MNDNLFCFWAVGIGQPVQADSENAERYFRERKRLPYIEPTYLISRTTLLLNNAWWFIWARICMIMIQFASEILQRNMVKIVAWRVKIKFARDCEALCDSHAAQEWFNEKFMVTILRFPPPGRRDRHTVES